MPPITKCLSTPRFPFLTYLEHLARSMWAACFVCSDSRFNRSSSSWAWTLQSVTILKHWGGVWLLPISYTGIQPRHWSAFLLHLPPGAGTSGQKRKRKGTFLLSADSTTGVWHCSASEGLLHFSRTTSVLFWDAAWCSAIALVTCRK